MSCTATPSNLPCCRLHWHAEPAAQAAANGWVSCSCSRPGDTCACAAHALAPTQCVYSMQVKGISAWRGRNCNNCCSLTCTQPPIPWRTCHDMGPRASHSLARDRSTGHTSHKIIHVATPLPALPHLPKGVIATPKPLAHNAHAHTAAATKDSHMAMWPWGLRAQGGSGLGQ